jgi:uncharacterized membrane protein affecting hemolysin expression
MNVYMKHINFQFVHNRNVLNASLYTVDGDTLVKGGRIAELLQECKSKGYTLVNAQEMLFEIVNVRGFTA